MVDTPYWESGMGDRNRVPLPEGQAELLEMIANGVPLTETLERLTLLIEEQSVGLYCSILLLDADGIHVHPAAGPHIPAEYMLALEGYPIGPTAGSCGKAMYDKKPVFVTDIVADPLWEPYRALLQPHGFRACWSYPIYIDQDRVLGSFAMYYREVRSPGECELELMSVATHIAGIAINRTRNEEELRRYQHELETLIHERTAQLVAEKNKAEMSAVALSKANQDLIASFNTLNAAQEDLIRNRQLAALGSLVAGVAHELNTPIGNCVLASSKLFDETTILSKNFANKEGVKRSDFMHYLNDVSEANDILMRNLERAANLVLCFKQVAVDQASSSRRKFQLRDTVGEIIDLLKIGFNQKPIHIDQHIVGSLELDSYPGALTQVLECVIENARVHAFEKRSNGTISITVNSETAGWVTMQIQDDGVGVLSQHIHKVFEPFYTTRMGSGSLGLGLNIAYNVVVGILGGTIKLSSETNRGTLVTISMPMVAPHLQNPALVRAG